LQSYALRHEYQNWELKSGKDNKKLQGARAGHRLQGTGYRGQEAGCRGQGAGGRGQGSWILKLLMIFNNSGKG